ncbi:MAG: Ribosomal large subunit pseudouridine synthase C [Pseudomonadales bacterium]|nr:Ribosomal large subunit pseudouridine synthase C [Pseudomonadales bacterium]
MNRQADAQTARVELVDIGSEHAGQRLDNFLLARLKGVPRSRVYRIVRSGEVRVNSARARPDQRLAAGDRVRVPPVRVAERVVAEPGAALQQTLRDRILYEDAALLVVDKPSGLAVHGGSGLSLGLIEALRAMRPDCASLELVHRLDRETSGCVMIARKRSLLRHLHEALREGTITKTYTMLVAGRWPKRLTRVAAALEKNTVRSGERVVRANGDGKASETLFRVLEHYRDATLLEARPLTGRTHQIRVHAQVSGHPVAGDEKYGEREFNKRMREAGLRRLFLHASAIELVLPDGRPLRVAAPLDPALEHFLETLPR